MGGLKGTAKTTFVELKDNLTEVRVIKNATLENLNTSKETRQYE